MKCVTASVVAPSCVHDMYIVWQNKDTYMQTRDYCITAGNVPRVVYIYTHTLNQSNYSCHQNHSLTLLTTCKALDPRFMVRARAKPGSPLLPVRVLIAQCLQGSSSSPTVKEPLGPRTGICSFENIWTTHWIMHIYHLSTILCVYATQFQSKGILTILAEILRSCYLETWDTQICRQCQAQEEKSPTPSSRYPQMAAPASFTRNMPPGQDMLSPQRW